MPSQKDKEWLQVLEYLKNGDIDLKDKAQDVINKVPSLSAICRKDPAYLANFPQFWSRMSRQLKNTNQFCSNITNNSLLSIHDTPPIRPTQGSTPVDDTPPASAMPTVSRASDVDALATTLKSVVKIDDDENKDVFNLFQEVFEDSQGTKLVLLMGRSPSHQVVMALKDDGHVIELSYDGNPFEQNIVELFNLIRNGFNLPNMCPNPKLSLENHNELLHIENVLHERISRRKTKRTVSFNSESITLSSATDVQLLSRFSAHIQA